MIRTRLDLDLLLACVSRIGFVIFIIQMFGSSQKSVEQKMLKDANFLSVYVYVYTLCLYGYVYTPVEAEVPKLSPVHMGHVRPKKAMWQLYTDN